MFFITCSFEMCRTRARECGVGDRWSLFAIG